MLSLNRRRQTNAYNDANTLTELLPVRREKIKQAASETVVIKPMPNTPSLTRPSTDFDATHAPSICLSSTQVKQERQGSSSAPSTNDYQARRLSFKRHRGSSGDLPCSKRPFPRYVIPVRRPAADRPRRLSLRPTKTRPSLSSIKSPDCSGDSFTDSVSHFQYF